MKTPEESLFDAHNVRIPQLQDEPPNGLGLTYLWKDIPECDRNLYRRWAEAANEPIRESIIATGLTEDEGSTLGMVASICDLAVDRVRLADEKCAELQKHRELLRIGYLGRFLKWIGFYRIFGIK